MAICVGWMVAEKVLSSAVKAFDAIPLLMGKEKHSAVCQSQSTPADCQQLPWQPLPKSLPNSQGVILSGLTTRAGLREINDPPYVPQPNVSA